MQIISILLSALGAVGGLLWLRSKWIERVTERSFYQLFPPTHEVLIVCATRSDLVVAPNVPTTVQDALAQAAIQAAFVRHGIPHRVKLHTQVSAEERMGDLFLVAGPGSNSLTKEFLAAVNFSFTFKGSQSDAYRIVDRKGHQLHPECDGAEDDYSILAAIRNPWAPPTRKARIYLAAGIEGLGTWGAASYISDSAGRLCKILRAHDIDCREGFEVLLCVKSSGPHTPNCNVARADRYPA
jgi:hypothetical protein